MAANSKWLVPSSSNLICSREAIVSIRAVEARPYWHRSHLSYFSLCACGPIWPLVKLEAQSLELQMCYGYEVPSNVPRLFPS